jgi:hypothetical protein
VEQRQPAERLWSALKGSADRERRKLTTQQAEDRVRDIATREGIGKLPDAAVRFYAVEYAQMVADKRQR